jgi:hypothetical protein
VSVPDDQDYADLGALLADPAHWTDEQAATARLVRRAQISALAEVDPRDQKRAADMAVVVKELDSAIAAWEAGHSG